jgi:hypothetical protein
MVFVDNKVTDVTARFIHDLTWGDIPPDVGHMAARCWPGAAPTPCVMPAGDAPIWATCALAALLAPPPEKAGADESESSDTERVTYGTRSQQTTP